MFVSIFSELPVMSPSNPSAHSYASWISQKPVNYLSPNNPVELVRAKVTQFDAVVNKLASQSPARVFFDHARLTLLLTEHLKKNPTATDPFNIKFRVDTISGDLVLQHFDLEYRIPQTGQDKTGRLREVVNLTVSQDFNSIDEKMDLLAAFDVAMRHDSSLAGFNLATRFAKADLLPTPDKLDDSMRIAAGNIPETKRHIARQLLARLIDRLIEPASRQIAQGQVVDAPALERIAKTGLMFLRTLNTGNPHDSIVTHTGLSTDQLAHLSTLLVVALGVFQDDFLQIREIEQFVTHLYSKVLNIGAVRSSADLLEHMPVNMRADRDVVIAAVQTNGATLEFASRNLQDDREVVLVAVQQNGAALAFASNQCLNDRELVLNAVRQFGLSLEFAGNEVRNDREVVMSAVLQDGMALETASLSLRGDRDVLLAAVRQDGLALEFGTHELTNDREVVMAAIQNNSLSLEFASDALRNDREVVMTAICGHSWVDDGFGIEAYALEYASNELRDDLEVVLAAVQIEGGALQVASPRLQANREVVMAAIQQNPSSIGFASEDLLNDPVLLHAAGLD